MEEKNAEAKKDFSGDFISKELKTVIIDGREFKFRTIDGYEHDEILNLYLTFIGKDIKPNLALKNAEFMKRTVIDAPYKSADGRPFKELSPDEKVALLQNLKAEIRNKLMKAIYDLNDPSEEELKK